MIKTTTISGTTRLIIRLLFSAVREPTLTPRHRLRQSIYTDLLLNIPLLSSHRNTCSLTVRVGVWNKLGFRKVVTSTVYLGKELLWERGAVFGRTGGMEISGKRNGRRGPFHYSYFFLAICTVLFVCFYSLKHTGIDCITILFDYCLGTLNTGIVSKLLTIYELKDST